MEIVHTAGALQALLAAFRDQGKRIGFVPTMGALHEGHASLMRKCHRENHISVCSIFVNPTQFNEKKDLDKYPRTLEADAHILRQIGTDLIYAPGVDDVYPPHLSTSVDVDFEDLDRVMEGVFRPGHFVGVAQVVKRLLDIVAPDNLYMGQKDFQQWTIIDHMIHALHLPVKLVVVRTKREADGLAMSSRNVRLKPRIRERANIIYKTLLASRRRMRRHKPADIEAYAMQRLSIPDFRPEYFQIVDGRSLKSIRSFAQHDYVVACTAVWADDVRLIDNLVFKKQ